MAAVMDLDLNCSPPSPEPVPEDHLKRAMLHQEHTFRHQVKDLHRLYWAQKNLTDVPFWKQSSDALYSRRSMGGCSHMMDLDDNHPDVLDGSYELGKQALQFSNGDLGVNGSVRRKPDHGGVQGRSGYRCVIDLEKPATLEDDDDVEIVSSTRFSDYANHNGGFLDNSQRSLLENATHVGSGSTGSSDTPDSHSPVKAKTNASGRILIDLNIAQQDDFTVYSDPSKVLCSLLASSSTLQSGECCNNSSKAFHKGSESSIGSSKGSSITVVTSVSATGRSREVMAAGFCDPQSTCKPFHVQASKHDALVRGNIHHQETQDKVSGLGSHGCTDIPGEVFSVRSSDGNSSSSGLHKLEDNRVASLMEEPAVVHREHQEETLTVISDDEMEGFDLNVSVGSIELPSMVVSGFREKHVNNDGSGKKVSSHYFTQNEDRQNIPSVEYPTMTDHHMAESIDGKSVRSPDPGTVINRSVLIPDTPQGRDYACPRLRSSNIGASNPLYTTSMHQSETEEDEKVAATAAETLVSLFMNNSAWITDSHCSNSQTDAQDGSHEPQLSLDSFEEGVMNLEEMKDDGESIPVIAPDKDGPSCGIKLKRGRGMRDFQREILPGINLTSGCVQAIEIMMSVLAQPVCNILLPRPGFPLYEARTTFSNLEVRHFNLIPERGWEADLESVKELADENTVAIVIVNPSNPCGCVYSHDHLAKIAETAQELGILVIADEVYDHLAFGNKPFIPMGVFGKIAPVITLGSISKRWLVPGWRLGWIATCDPNGILKEAKVDKSIQDYTNISTDPATFIQGAVPQIIANTKEDYFNKILDLLRNSADLCYGKIKDIRGITCPHKPEGSMFVMVKLDFSSFDGFCDDMDFSCKLAKEESVIVLPGTALGMKDWIRITFAIDLPSLEDGLERIRSFCERHGRVEA